jgi:predicted phosphodiesterase
MRILIFSDSHLYTPVDHKKLEFLKKIIKAADRVIINGDFYDSYMNTFEEFLNSQWKELFPLLKSKKAIYIYGNHDARKSSDKKADLFSEVQAERYKIKTGNKTFIFEHGHKTRVTADVSHNIPWKWLHRAIVIGHIGRQIMVSLLGKLFLRLRFSYRNKNSKRRIMEMYDPKEDEIYIIGHNHWGEIDVKNHFASTGAILYGYYQYLTIEDSVIKLHEGWYR